MLSEKTQQEVAEAIMVIEDTLDVDLSLTDVDRLTSAAISAVLNGDEIKTLLRACDRAETEMRYAGFSKLEDDNVGKKPAYFELLQAVQPFLPVGE